ncbi:MAG: cation-translocating P-type ATPase [Acidobacteria bacterium]|nr:cation-translocating P-type ATPase [Acidobacteriota bacterium]
MESSKRDWHRRQSADVLRELGSADASGLSEAAAAQRLVQVGPNELTGTGIKSPWLILWEQLTALMVVILIIAGVVSALLGDFKDAIAIGAIVVLNAILGFTQEYRAEKAMAALKKLSVPAARVRRDGLVREIPSTQLVPGDIVYLEAGNYVPADCRLIENAGLQAQEAALTGESEPVHKITEAIDHPELPLGDRRNMAYMGTFVTVGRGAAVVTDTGMRTELGHIATMIQRVDRAPTPLQRRLEHLGKGLAAAALAIVALIFVLGLVRGENLQLMLLTAVSIGVAAVPEGLPAVVTIALTLGAQRMLKRRVLIRKLPAVEALGSVTVICSDKTGTLTQNRMTATMLQLADRVENAEGPVGATRPDTALLLAASALCNDAASDDLGDPTETALTAAASRFGLQKAALDSAFPRTGEVPFDSVRKRMTTVHQIPGDRTAIPDGLRHALNGHSAQVAFTKGAVDSLLDISSSVWVDGSETPLDAHWRRRLSESNEAMAAKGMRVLGVGFRSLADATERDPEQNLTLIGMIGIIDPARPEAAEAVETCRKAGIRPVMITGDHPLTASYIAAGLGIPQDAATVTGAQLEKMPEAELEQTADHTSVYARVSPAHKLRIVEGLQRKGQIVAMTGDGVNDAPALKRADIGVAMGVTGTDVAKEAADMVLLDDNFATIVAAVEQGRVIYDNIRKFIKYILATNSGEIWLMLLSPFLGMPLPLLPLQILWMNLVTDGLPALALGVEPADPDVMRRPPHPPSESIFARGLGRHVIWVGLLMGLLSLALGYYYWKANDSHWQTMLFTTLTLSQMAHVMAIRSEHQSLFRIGLFSNRPLIAAVTLTVVLQIALIYVPFLQTFFKTEALPFTDLVITVAASSVVFWAVELEKWLFRRGEHRG